MAGSVRQRGKNRWEVRVYVPSTRRYVSRTVAATSKRAAQREADRLHREVADGQHRAQATTFGELLDQWHLARRSTWAPATAVAYAAATKRLKERLAHVRLDKLRALDLDRAYAEAVTTVSSATVRKMHHVASAALRQAMRWDLVGRNVADLATPPPLRQREVRSPSTSELALLVSHCDDPDFVAFLHVAATTGARRGELCALRWRDIDFEKSTVRIESSITMHNGVKLVKDTKTHRSRSIPLDPEALACLRALRVRRAKVTMACGVPMSDEDYVFSPRPEGREPFVPLTMTRRFNRLTKRAGVRGVTLHGLRHLVGTQLVGSGVDVRTVADRLGHSRASTTLNTYTHRLGDNDRRAGDVIGEIVASAFHPDDPGRSAAQ